MNLNLDQVLQIHLAGDLALAEKAYRYLLGQPNPENMVLINLAAICYGSNRIEEAIALLERVLVTTPESPEACNNLGKIFQDLGDHKQAVTLCQKAINGKEAFVEAHYNLANSLFMLEKFREAIFHYELALLYDPKHYNAHIRLAVVLLLLGAFKKGWKEYNHRFIPLDPVFPLPVSRKWDGDFLYQGELVLTCELNKGFGDTIQFSSYLSLLKEHGLKISLWIQEPLRELFENWEPELRIYSVENYTGLDLYNSHWFPLMSLPYLFQTDLSNIPLSKNSSISKEYQDKWKIILGSTSKIRLAIAWQGNLEHETFDAKGRSFPLEALAPIAELPNIEFISLQKFAGSEQLETCSFRNKFIHCQEQISQSTSFLDTAAIMQQCDLIITSDTSVAHLAGTLNLKTWVALKKLPEWRWMLNREDTPWYPSLTLFRQKQDGAWQEVFENMAAKLKSTLSIST